MIPRHPQVFGNAERGDTAAQTEARKTEKTRERHRRTEFSALDGIAGPLPAMIRAQKLARRAARVGFDWPDIAAVLDKLDEELAELRAELPRPAATPDLNRIEDEIGDIFFVLVNLARKLHVSSESALARANAKFERRFRAMEAILIAAGETPEMAGLKKMEDLWCRVKLSER